MQSSGTGALIGRQIPSSGALIPAKRRVFDFQNPIVTKWRRKQEPDPDSDPDSESHVQDWSASAVRHADDDLCASCRRINFDLVFDMETSMDVTRGQTIAELGLLRPFSNEITCRFCGLLALVRDRNRGYDSYGPSEWSLWVTTTSSLWDTPHAVMARAQQLSIVLAIGLSGGRHTIGKKEKRAMIARGVILPYRDSLDPDLRGSVKCTVVKSMERVDFSRVNKLLADCDCHHSTCRRKREGVIKFPTQARVIDCQARRVVSLVPAARYVALSYVWGPKRQQGVSQPCKDDPEELAEQLPEVVESAITATRALGFRYLWVDRYCIGQSQSQDTQHQIRQMANIYSHAVVTICALGSHEDVELPGVRSKRKKQLRIKTRHMTLAWTGPSVRRFLQHSEWMSRGWTYQESMLSRRCLFFTEYYAALICDAGVFPENLRFDGCESWSFRKEAEFWDVMEATPVGWSTNPTQQFLQHLRAFRNRKLSYITDRLNAFKGILSQLRVQSYWGIPVCKLGFSCKDSVSSAYSREQEAGFIAGLCWQTEGKSAWSSLDESLDNAGFPSWSWVGQDPVIDSNCLADARQFEVMAARFSTFQAGIVVECLNGESMPFEDMVRRYVGSKVLPEQTRFLKLTSVALECWWRQTPKGIEACLVNEHAWWWSETLGNLRWDRGLNSLESNGVAVLLALQETRKFPGRNPTSIRAVWLAVTKMTDGTFRRRGIIVSSRVGNVNYPVRPPGTGWLETIVLG